MRVPRAEVGDDHSHRAAADSAGHLAVKSGGSKVGEFVGASVEERAQLRGLSGGVAELRGGRGRKSTRLNSSHGYISYAVFCLKKKTTTALHIDPHWI